MICTLYSHFKFDKCDNHVKYTDVQIYVNGSVNTGVLASSNVEASIGSNSNVSTLLDLSAGDTLKLYVWHNEGGTEGLDAGIPDTFMAGVRIGT